MTPGPSVSQKLNGDSDYRKLLISSLVSVCNTPHVGVQPFVLFQPPEGKPWCSGGGKSRKQPDGDWQGPLRGRLADRPAGQLVRGFPRLQLERRQTQG